MMTRGQRSTRGPERIAVGCAPRLHRCAQSLQIDPRAERRAQINSHQPLPNLPGQALYLARINMMSAYKDLTDVAPIQNRPAQ